jgi:hypothetical protein
VGERGASAKQKERETAKNTTAVYKRSLLLKLESPLLLLILRMGIERKKTKTRRPSWRRAASEQRRCAKQLIPLAGSKPARSRPPTHAHLPLAFDRRSAAGGEIEDPIRWGERGGEDIFPVSSPV